MKKTPKFLCLLLSIVMVLGMTACGSNNVTAGSVSDETIQADAQEYLSSFVGEDAKITNLSYNQNGISDTERTVTSKVSFTAGGADGTATFNMTYVLENGTWTLNGMDAQLGESSSEEPAPAPDSEPTADPEPVIDTPVSSVEGVSAIRGIQLKKTGTVEENDVQIDDDFSYFVYKDGTVSEPYYDIKGSLGEGYLIVVESNEDVNTTGLVTSDGEVLIPCEAAIIEWVDTRDTEDRFLKVVYGTEITTNEDEAYFFVHSGFFAIAPSEGDVLYKGYAKIYDVVNKQFVGNLQTSYTGPDAIYACGDSVVLTDAEDNTYLYDCNGNLIKQTSRLAYAGNGYMICHDSGAYEVYDTTGTLRLSSTDTLSTVTSTHGFLKKKVDGKYILIDPDGNQILPDAYKSIEGECNGIVEVKNDKDEYQLIRLDGEVLVTTTAYVHETGWNSGYYYFQENEMYTLVGPEGIIATDLKSNPSDLIVEKDDALLVLNDKTFSLTLDDYRDLYYDGLIAARSDETGKFGLYDLYTGKQLLDLVYNEITVENDILRARQGETWTIFEIIPQIG